MWGIAPKPNPLRDRMLLSAPEANPHQFVLHMLFSKAPAGPAKRTQRPGFMGSALQRRRAGDI